MENSIRRSLQQAVSAVQNQIFRTFPVRMELGRLIRESICATEGYTFVDADYSQIELIEILRIALMISN